MSASLHYFIYCLIAIVAIAELILTIFLFNEDVQDRSFHGVEYHNLLIVSIGASAWTIFFGFMYALMIRAWLVHFLDNVAISLWWLLFTSTVWAATMGLFHKTRTGNVCDGLPLLSNCRQSLTVESLGWTELGLCLFTICTTWVWVTDESLIIENDWTTTQGIDSTRGPSTVQTAGSAV